MLAGTLEKKLKFKKNIVVLGIVPIQHCGSLMLSYFCEIPIITQNPKKSKKTAAKTKQTSLFTRFSRYRTPQMFAMPDVFFLRSAISIPLPNYLTWSGTCAMRSKTKRTPSPGEWRAKHTRSNHNSSCAVTLRDRSSRNIACFWRIE